MSAENVEIVHQIFDAWAHGDLRASGGHFDRHIMLVVRPDFPEAGVFVGPEGVRKYMTRFLEQWERLVLLAQEIRESGDSVWVRLTQRGTGRASGIESEMSYFQIFTFRGPSIIRIEVVLDEAEALEVAGLSV